MRDVARHIALFLAVLGLVGSASAQDPNSDGSSEYLIKAGYIYNFAKLVEWPSGAARHGQPMVIGVLGNDAFAAVLERVVDGKKIDDRPFVIKRMKNREFKDCGCQILFIAAAESALADDIIHFQNSASVLTIAEAPDFARRGGIIAFTLEDSRVRFQVNVDAATQAALTISSRLLTLAKIVHTAR